MAYPASHVAGESYVLGVSQPALRHVTDLGADGLFIEGASAPAANPYPWCPRHGRACCRGCAGYCAGASRRPRCRCCDRLCTCSNRVVGVRRPAWWCYPERCQNGHECGPGLIIASWVLCHCPAARGGVRRWLRLP